MALYQTSTVVAETEFYLQADHYSEVVVTSILSEKALYVQSLSENRWLTELTANLGACSLSKREVTSLNAKYLVYFKNHWRRVTITNLYPLKGLFIDFGNEEIILGCSIKDVPPALLTIPPQVFRGNVHGVIGIDFKETQLRVATSRSVDSFVNGHVQNRENCSLDDIRNTSVQKDVNNIPDGILDGNDDINGLSSDLQNCQLKGKIPCSLKFLQDRGSFLISSTLGKNVYTIIPKFVSLNAIIAQIDHVETASYENYKPEVGDIVAVFDDEDEDEKTTLRGWVMGTEDSEDKTSFKIALIDYGRMLKTTKVKPLQEECKTIPYLALVAEFPVHASSFEKDTEIDVEITNITDDGTAGSGVVLNGTDLKFELRIWEPSVETLGLEFVNLKCNEKVSISYFDDNNVYLIRTSSESIAGFNRLSQRIYNAVEKEPEVTRIYYNELLAAKNVHGQFYRVQVMKINDDDTCDVIFLDLGYGARLSKSCLKRLPRILKREPCFAVKVILKDVQLSSLNSEAQRFLERVQKERMQLSVLPVSRKIFQEVYLYFTNGKCLNDNLI